MLKSKTKPRKSNKKRKSYDIAGALSTFEAGEKKGKFEDEDMKDDPISTKSTPTVTTRA